MGVHFFRRTTRDEFGDRDLRPMQRIDVELPNSPLSYEGVILKIRWIVRVRLYLTGGREYLEERPFTLGSVPAAKAIEDESEANGKAERLNEAADARGAKKSAPASN